MNLPDEVWIGVVQALVDDCESYKITLQLLHNYMLVNQQSYAIANDWQVWRKVAQLFSDYARLRKRHLAVGIDWKTIVQDRLKHIVTEREILVGDRAAPERRYLVQVHGSGNMFIGGDIDKTRAQLIHQFTDNVWFESMQDALVKYGDNEFIMQPFHLIGNGQNALKVVDISTFDPFMLVLTETGEVIEFIFKPSWDTKWDEFAKPRRLEFPSKVQIEKIYAMDYAFMAIHDGHIFVWSVIDNPIGGENIRTPPTRIDALRDMFVYYVEPLGNTTRLYYAPRKTVNTDSLLKFKSPYKDDIVDPDAMFVDIENAQVMQIIAASVFTEAQIEEIAEKIRALMH